MEVSMIIIRDAESLSSITNSLVHQRFAEVGEVIVFHALH